MRLMDNLKIKSIEKGLFLAVERNNTYIKITDYIGDYFDMLDKDIILCDNVTLSKRLWYHLFVCYVNSDYGILTIENVLDDNLVGKNIRKQERMWPITSIRLKKIISLKL
jgi:hypothetical protein